MTQAHRPYPPLHPEPPPRLGPDTPGCPEILVEEPDAEAVAPARLYARHLEYARALALQLADRRQLDPFAREELIDAALEGLLDAAQLWPDRPHLARFSTFAYWHVRGRVASRAEELRLGVCLPTDDAGEESPDEPTLRIWPYVEQQLHQLTRQERLVQLVGTLRQQGELTPLEEQLVDPLLLEPAELQALADEQSLPRARVRVAALRLLQKLRAALRDDSLFPDRLCRIPADELPARRSEALTVARETLAWLATPAGRADPTPGRIRPLAGFCQLLPAAVRAQTAPSTGGAPADPRPPFARVASFYQRALGLDHGELAGELAMNRPAVQKMMHCLNLDSRRSLPRLVTVANTLGIDPEQLLFSSAPELMSAFDRVVYAGDDVYLALIDVALPPAELVAAALRPPPPGLAHAFGPVVAAYRLARGYASASALGRYQRALESGTPTAVAGTLEAARLLQLPPLLALLGTRPELLAAFDLLDGDGRLLHASVRDYARVVVVLRQVPATTLAPAPAEAPGPGLGGFLRWCLARHGPRLTPTRLAEAGVSPLLLANALAGRAPHQPEALRPLAALLALDPFEEARLCCEALLARPGAEGTAELTELCELAREQSAWLTLLASHDWPDCGPLGTADGPATRRLTAQYYGRSRRGHRGYVRELLRLWRNGR